VNASGVRRVRVSELSEPLNERGAQPPPLLVTRQLGVFDSDKTQMEQLLAQDFVNAARTGWDISLIDDEL
jgi:hypothetical protein